MIVRQNVDAVPTLPPDWDARWNGPDAGLIACWVRGIELSRERPDLARSAMRGELPELPWRGGIREDLKIKKKYGVHEYLAMWQGLRGESLNIDSEDAATVTCSRFGVSVTFISSARWLDMARRGDDGEGPPG